MAQKIKGKTLENGPCVNKLLPQWCCIINHPKAQGLKTVNIFLTFIGLQMYCGLMLWTMQWYFDIRSPPCFPADSKSIVWRYVIGNPKLSNCVFFFFLLFRAEPVAYGSSQAGVESELQPPANTTATAAQGPSWICNLHISQHWILTHWAGPGIEPSSLWMLVGFVTAEPWQELPPTLFLSDAKIKLTEESYYLELLSLVSSYWASVMSYKMVYFCV